MQFSSVGIQVIPNRICRKLLSDWYGEEVVFKIARTSPLVSEFLDNEVLSTLPLQQLINLAFNCFVYFLLSNPPFFFQFCKFFCVNRWHNEVFNNIHFGVFIHNTLESKLARRVVFHALLSFKLVEPFNLVDSMVEFVVKHVVGASFGRFFWLNN